MPHPTHGEATATQGATTAPDDLKSAVRQRVDGHRDDLVSLSRRIHGHPETAFTEHRAAAWCAEALAAAGFTVDSPAYGLDTAFSATLGPGPRTVAIVCEYDALPDLGHACGHNLIAAAGVGAALALAPFADELGLRIRVLGTPAEERGAGKALMIDAGAFDGVDAAMMVHPAGLDLISMNAIAVPLTANMYSLKFLEFFLKDRVNAAVLIFVVAGVPLDRLTLEITESVYLGRRELFVQRQMEEMQQHITTDVRSQASDTRSRSADAVAGDSSV